MKRGFSILFFLISLCLITKGQTNLIYNGDFELYDSCPTNLNQLGACTGWIRPTLGSSDYYNACAGSIVGIPSNVVGYQNALSGKGYAGVYFEFNRQFSSYGYWVEYVQGSLVHPLTAGKEYRFSAMFSYAPGFADVAMWKLGAYFSTSPVSRADAVPFELTPQVLNANGNFITDTAGWTKVSGSFVAAGGEEFVTVGFFCDTLNLDTLHINYISPPQPLFFKCYYFLDDCMLKEVTSLPNVFSPDNDGQNDYIDFSDYAQAEELVTIYDRWGSKVFETTLNNKKWDGKDMKGNDCNDGVYYYLFHFADFINSAYNEIDRKGFIHLIR